jgi:phage shock protein C
MTCANCHREIPEVSNYCHLCGALQRPTPYRRLMRSAQNSKIAGVCGGIAEYFNVDPTMVRLIWIALSVVPGAFAGGILAYLLAWIVIPKAPVAATTPSAAPFEHAAKTS